MLAPRIVIVSEYHAYMQKQKPQPIGQPDIETLAMRLNVNPADCDAIVRDDVMEDVIGGSTPARRVDAVVRGKALLPGSEYATSLDDSPDGRVTKAVEKAAKSPKLAKAKAKAAADAAESKQLISEEATLEAREKERIAKNNYNREWARRKRAKAKANVGSQEGNGNGEG